MADITDIVAMLAPVGLPIAEGRWEPDSADTGPHIVVRHEGKRSLKANGISYAHIDQWSATLYSERWESSLEESIETEFANAGIPCDAMSGYDDEHSVNWTEWDFETMR